MNMYTVITYTRETFIVHADDIVEAAREIRSAGYVVVYVQQLHVAPLEK